MQGTKDDNRDFYKLIKSVFTTIGLFSTSFDYGFFVDIYYHTNIILLYLFTDDYILVCKDIKIHTLINSSIKKAFNITS